MFKAKLKIESVWGKVLWESERTTVREALQDAVLQGADLRGAVLQGADLQGADLQGADLQDADLQDAVLQDAVLQGAVLRGVKNLPQSYINQCSRDMLFIFQALKSELPFLREKLVKGEVNGTKYEGDCACLIGTLGNANGGTDKVCSAIPYYDMGLHNFGEQWFWQIRLGDTPENSFFAEHALKLIDSVLKTAKKNKKLSPR